MNNKKNNHHDYKCKDTINNLQFTLTTYNSRQSQGLFDIHQKRLATLFGAANHY